MKVTETNKSIIGGAIRSREQTIAQEHIDMATSMFRDRIYTDKIKAALIETLTNAIDEHRKHNVTRPVDILVSRKEICIRDFALGLAEEETFGTFFQFFKSTKNTSNTFIGGFGFGAKAPGAYNPTYFVESFYGGKKSVYMSVPKGFKSIANLIKVEDTELPSGICVRIPIKSKEDAKQFLFCALDAYKLIGFYTDPLLQEIRIIPTLTRDYSYDWYCSIINDKEKLDSLSVDAIFDEYNKRFKSVDSYYRKDWPQEAENWGRDAEHRMYKPLKFTDYNGIYKDFLLPLTAELAKHNIIYNNKELIINNKLGFVSRNNFNYSFFCQSAVYAYDGDMMYKLQLPDNIINKYILHNSFLGYDKTVIIFFKRGELIISPSRETIEQSDILNNFIESRLIEAITELKEAVKSSLKEFISKDFITYSNFYNWLQNTILRAFYQDSEWKNLVPPMINFPGVNVLKAYIFKNKNSDETTDLQVIQDDISTQHWMNYTTDFDSCANSLLACMEKQNRFVIINDLNKSTPYKKIIQGFLKYISKNKLDDKIILGPDCEGRNCFFFIQKHIQKDTDKFTDYNYSVSREDYPLHLKNNFIDPINKQFKKTFDVTYDIFKHNRDYFYLSEFVDDIPVTRTISARSKINADDLTTCTCYEFVGAHKKYGKTTLAELYNAGKLDKCRFATVKEFNETGAIFGVKNNPYATPFNITGLFDASYYGSEPCAKLLFPDFYLCSKAVKTAAIALGATEFTPYDVFKAVKTFLVKYNIKVLSPVIPPLCRLLNYIDIYDKFKVISYETFGNILFDKRLIDDLSYSDARELQKIIKYCVEMFNDTDKSSYSFRKDISDFSLEEYNGDTKDVTEKLLNEFNALFDGNFIEKLVFLNSQLSDVYSYKGLLLNDDYKNFEAFKTTVKTKYKDKIFDLIKRTLNVE